MNKNSYRIVFNKARNLMMAVAENTTSQGKGRQSGSGQAGGGEDRRGASVIELFQLKPLAFFTLCLFGLQPVLLQAAVTADANAPANKKPTIDSTANGIPLVQIAAPSGAGVSHNLYNQFNVGSNGVILNNSQGLVQTQLGGYVTGNPNLANGSAKIILNEVTGTGSSLLQGYTEVAGQKAEVIIANPNGIVCDGCGFINTSRGILTTGVPMLGSGGSLDSFRVTGGQITIGEGGLNAANIDQLDLITRSLQVNGKIWANNLNAIVGTNQVDYTTLGVQVIAGDADKPTVGIDVALLGGMYANKIRLVGTETGVGVNSQGTLAAQAGDFTLDNQGNITLSGNTKASGNIAITTTNDLNNSGTLDGKTITTTSTAFNNSFEVLGDTVTINSATLNNQTKDAKISANISADLKISGDITNQGTIQAYNVTTTSNDFNNTGAVLGANVKINAVNLNNTGETAVIAATDKIDLLISNSVSNTDGATIWSLGDLNAAKSSAVDADGYLTDKMVSFTNSSGTVQADGDLRISADQITNKKTVFEIGQTVVVGDQVNSGSLHYIPTVTTDYVKTDSSAAMLLSGGNMWLKGSINNDYSIVTAVGDIHFDVINFKQKSYDLTSVETQVGTQDYWHTVQGPDLCVKVGGFTFSWNCQNTYYSKNDPIAYNQTITNVIDTKSGSASFTAGGDITGSANTLSNLKKGDSSITLGAIQTALPPPDNSNPTLNITLPKNGLFKYNTAPGQHYLIETNPLFANYKTFISSDYMLSKLNLDPALTQKKLGDAFYEQKLVSDQITNLTGRRFLPGYTSAEAEFIALMDQGLSEAHAQNLIPGVTLTAAQVAALTYDIVWMVSRDITLPNGSIEKLLMPQVFLSRLHANDLRPNGSLITAENINIKIGGTLQNSGTIVGSKSTTLTATDITNHGNIGSLGDTRLNASNDIKNQSGSISGVRVAVLAGHDLINETDTEELQLGNVFTTNIHDTASITASDTLDMQAGNDLAVTAANIVSGGNANLTAGNNLTIQAKAASESASILPGTGSSAGIPLGTGASGSISQTTQLVSQVQSGGNLSLQAKNEVNLAAVKINAEQKLNVAAKNINITAAKDTKQSSFDGGGLTMRNYDETVVGSSLQAGGDVELVANGKATDGQGNINITGSQISSQSGKVSLTSSNNVNINAEDERHESFEQRISSSSGFLSSSKTTTVNQSSEQIARGSSIEGDNITIKTGNDINVIGSDIVATGDTSLTAKNNIALTASKNTYTSSHFSLKEESGFMSGSGASISYGQRNNLNTQANTDISHTASNVGSLNGNVSIKAGQDYTQSGSNVLTPQGDINIAAQEVLVNEVQNTGNAHQETKATQSGLTLALTSSVVDAVNAVESMRKASDQTKSSRMKNLAIASGALIAANTANTIAKAGGINKAGISLSLSYGESSNQSQSTQNYSNAQGSNVTAGGNINIVSTAAGDADNDLNKNKRGNITIQGSDIKAGKDTTLEADNNLNLLAAKSTAGQHSTNSSSSGSIGVGYSTSNGFSVTASASIARGNADGNDVTWTNSHLDAGNTLTIKSGQDTNIKGAIASGKQVTADIGGNLNIESLQDTSVYDSKQKSMGMSISVPIGAGSASGSYNDSNTKVNSNYASVMEQSGIKTGDGGFQVKVKGNTDLKGAVIASTDKAIQGGKNSLSTGTLTTSDIENKSESSANSSGINLSSDMLTQGKYGVAKGVIGNALNNGEESGSSSGRSHSAVSGGAVVITDEIKQIELTGKSEHETVASLNRDTTNAQISAQRLDVQAMERSAEAERAIKQEAVKQVTVHTDAAYKAMFKTDTKLYKVTCSSTPEKCLNDPKLVHEEVISRDEAKKDGKILAVNGILNDASRAGQLAYQNAPVDETTGQKSASITLMHIPSADTGLGDVFVAAYEKLLAPILGYTNADLAYADLLQGRGDDVTLSLGHSRGTIVQRNAFNIAADNGYVNKNLEVVGVGGGVGYQEYTDAAARVIQYKKQAKENITYTYMANDPVSVIAAGNPGNFWSAVKEFNNVYWTSNSAHSCYGSGSAGCSTIANPIPGGPVSINQNLGLIRVYRGGELVSP